MDRRKATAKLFEMVQRSQTDNIHSFLDRGANINARDKDGNTPLIIAARNRNYVLQDLLLSRGADVRKTDKSGRSALHHEAWAGDLECVNLLLAHGADVNAQDSEGRTSLMFAVNSGHFKVADILVFCGADGTIKAKDGKSPASICKSADFKALMKESKQIVEGIRNGLVKIQQRVLRPEEGREETEIDLPEVGLHLRVKSQSLGRGVGLLMRRVPPELSRSSLAPGDKELLLSDTFEYRLARAAIDGGALVTIPVFSAPTIFESAFIKTDIMPDVDETLIDPISHFDIENQGDLCEEEVSCTTEIDMGSITAFLLVTQIRVEHFPMTSKGGLLTSEIDESVQINVPPNCFGDVGDVTLEIIPRPIIKPNEFRHLVAISHFYDVKHTEKEQPKQGLPPTLHLPLPRTYRGTGKFVALLRSTPPDDDEDDDYDEDDFEKEVNLWDLVDDNPSRDAKRANFNLPHFSSACIMEALSGTTDTDAKRTAAQVYLKARLRERQVSFDAFLRPKQSDRGSDPRNELEVTEENSDLLYDLVVTCSEIKQLHRTKDFFQNDGYRYFPQNHEEGNERTVIPKQQFSIEPDKGNFKKEDKIHHRVQFHPKREHQNLVQMTLTIDSWEKDLVGWILVEEDKGKVKHPAETSEKFKDVTLEINVERDLVQEDNRFMNDTFMKWLAQKVRKDFKRFGKYLGLSETTIRKIDVNKKSELVFKMLRLWRGKCQGRLDLGLPGLLYALGKTEKKDVQSEVVKKLRAWLQSEKAEDSPFKAWAEAEVAAPASDSAREVGQPMSDDYLQWVVWEMGTKPHVRDLAPKLNIPMNQVEYIEQDPFAKGKLWQILKLLKSSRDRQDSHVKAFADLMALLEKQRFEEIRNEAIRRAKKWTDSMTTTADPFAHQLESLLEEDIYEVPEPQPEDVEDAVSRPVSRNAGTPRPGGTAGTPRRQGPDMMRHNRGVKKDSRDGPKRPGVAVDRSKTSGTSSAMSEDERGDEEREEKKHLKEKPSSGGKRDSSPSSSSTASKQDSLKSSPRKREDTPPGNKQGRSSSRSNRRRSSSSNSSSNNSSNSSNNSRSNSSSSKSSRSSSSKSRSRSSSSSSSKSKDKEEHFRNKQSSDDKADQSSGEGVRSSNKEDSDQSEGKRDEEKAATGVETELTPRKSSNKLSKEDKDERNQTSFRDSGSKDESAESKKGADDKKEKKGTEDEEMYEDQQSQKSHTSTDTTSKTGSAEKENQKEDEYNKSASGDRPRRGSHSRSDGSSTLSADGKEEDIKPDQVSVSSKEKRSSTPPSDGGSDTEEEKSNDGPSPARRRTSVDSETGSDRRGGVQGKPTARTDSQTSLNSKRSQEFPNARITSDDGDVEYFPVHTPGSSESTDDSNNERNEEKTVDDNVFEEEKTDDEGKGKKKSGGSQKRPSRQSSSSTISSRGRRSEDGSNLDNTDTKDVAA